MTIRNFPEEIWAIIFKELSILDYDQCQRVCQSWYLSAHKLQLRNINLTCVKDVELFIKSIDHNPKPIYLCAVYSIHIHDSTELYNFELDQETADKLFLRFGKLKQLIIDNKGMSTKILRDDGICESIATRLQHLEKVVFNVNPGEEVRYYKLLYGLKHSITTMPIIQNMTTLCPTIEQYITSFPRLQRVQSSTEKNNYISFEEFLPLIEKMSGLQEFAFNQANDQPFIEQFLETKTNGERDTILNRLSNIKSISTSSFTSLCPNFVQFMTQYLTGLKSLSFKGRLILIPWRVLGSSASPTNILNLACSLEYCHFSLTNAGVEDIQKCAKPIFDKVFCQLPLTYTHITRNLQVSLLDKAHCNRSFPYDINSTLSTEHQELVTRSIQLVSNNGNPDTLNNLFEQVFPFHDTVHTFTLDVDRNLEGSIFRDALQHTLAGIPYIEAVVLDVPEEFNKKKIKFTNNSVSTVTLRPFSEKSIKSMTKCMDIFTKMKNLRLFYFCGVWCKKSLKYQIMLRQYTLEKLSIDLMPLKTSNDIVIQIDFFENCERRLYKVASDLSSLECINFSSLKGLKRSQDYTFLHINISSLKHLELFMCRGKVTSNTYYDEWETGKIRCATLFKD